MESAQDPGAAAATGEADAAGSRAADAAGSRAVTFYVLEEASSAARLKLACRITEKAFQAGQSVLIWHTDATELAMLDELLWTFGDDRSFIPHERIAPGTVCEAPVLLTTGLPTTGPRAAGPSPARITDVLINLAADLPPITGQAARIVEIVDGDATRREAGRTRYKAYRELGLQPVTHNVRGA